MGCSSWDCCTLVQAFKCHRVILRHKKMVGRTSSSSTLKSQSSTYLGHIFCYNDDRPDIAKFQGTLMKWTQCLWNSALTRWTMERCHPSRFSLKCYDIKPICVSLNFLYPIMGYLPQAVKPFQTKCMWPKNPGDTVALQRILT